MSPSKTVKIWLWPTSKLSIRDHHQFTLCTKAIEVYHTIAMRFHLLLLSLQELERMVLLSTVSQRPCENLQADCRADRAANKEAE